MHGFSLVKWSASMAIRCGLTRNGSGASRTANVPARISANRPIKSAAQRHVSEMGFRGY